MDRVYKPAPEPQRARGGVTIQSEKARHLKKKEGRYAIDKVGPVSGNGRFF
jgi:hypothetical protein